MIDKQLLITSFETIKTKSPLVHNITNYVAMNSNANALLAIGASPVMAHAVPEMGEMASIAAALVINIGTLDEGWVEGMLTAGMTAYNRRIPIILDPVGAGATRYRTDTAWKIINLCHPTIIKGNGSEIMALLHAEIKSKGVDSSESSDHALESAKELALRTNAVVVVSGAIDYITDGNRVEIVKNGAPIMGSVTAMGCTATAVIGAFSAIEEPFMASVHGMVVMGIAGERAAAYSKGSGSMQVNFIDELYNLSAEIITNTLIP